MSFLQRSVLCALLLLYFAPSVVAQQHEHGVIGAQVVPVETGQLVVLRVLPDSPAQKAGLKAGDLIVRINDFDLSGSDFENVVRTYLWGRTGTTVTVYFLRPGVPGRSQARILRSPVNYPVPAMPGVKMVEPEGN